LPAHQVVAPGGSTVRDGGWGVACDTAPPSGDTGPGWALARRQDGLTTALVSLLGDPAADAPHHGTVAHTRGHNAYGRYAATPLLTSTHPGGTLLLVTLVVVTADPSVHRDPHALRTGTRAAVTAGKTVEVRFPDGHEEQVRLAAEHRRPPSRTPESGRA
ncbi:hypothetical protein ABZS97_09370, partial [Streptomyces sp. NPDC005485]